MAKTLWQPGHRASRAGCFAQSTTARKTRRRHHDRRSQIGKNVRQSGAVELVAFEDRGSSTRGLEGSTSSPHLRRATVGHRRSPTPPRPQHQCRPRSTQNGRVQGAEASPPAAARRGQRAVTRPSDQNSVASHAIPRDGSPDGVVFRKLRFLVIVYTPHAQPRLALLVARWSPFLCSFSLSFAFETQ